MRATGQIDFIKEWSSLRGLSSGDSSKQLIKLMEEVGELAEAHNKGFRDKQIDSIGDIFVVLTIYGQQTGLNIADCIDKACEEIAGRDGKTVDGVFIKSSDLEEGGNDE